MTTQRTVRIDDTVGNWPEVITRDNGRMGIEFRLGRIELGHLHGRHIAHLPMPKRLRDELIAAGKATPHPVMPDSGWVQMVIATAEDREHVISTFRQNYDRARNRAAHARGTTAP